MSPAFSLASRSRSCTSNSFDHAFTVFRIKVQINVELLLSSPCVRCRAAVQNQAYRALDFFDSHAIYVALVELFSRGAVRCGITTIECIWRRCRLGEEIELVGKRWLIRGLRLVLMERMPPNRVFLWDLVRVSLQPFSLLLMLSAVDLMESLAVGQTRVQQSTEQSVDPMTSGTSSSQPSMAPQSFSRKRFRPRGRKFKRSTSSSSSSGGSIGSTRLCHNLTSALTQPKTPNPQVAYILRYGLKGKQYATSNLIVPKLVTACSNAASLSLDLDIHAQGRAVNPRQGSIESYMHRDLTQPRHLMTPTESVNGSK
ncbi:glycine hydroxymethyltransferase family protein [Dorcoceras hygrometricum]|uniref:Glycine hydroxymethyltransferase family protein n=1 Tax=Dorcoceras hygrometricum TaxID=472368 RepID=A0A2Z7A466_9LAMI|nr:glycine hydroxymethyltransferase family protein [Dorcoceras hygrometricum]